MLIDTERWTFQLPVFDALLSIYWFDIVAGGFHQIKVVLLISLNLINEFIKLITDIIIVHSFD